MTRKSDEMQDHQPPTKASVKLVCEIVLTELFILNNCIHFHGPQIIAQLLYTPKWSIFKNPQDPYINIVIYIIFNCHIRHLIK